MRHSNIIYCAKILQSNYFYCAQAAFIAPRLLKFKKSKDVFKESNLASGNQLLPIFQIPISSWQAPENKIRGSTGLELV